MCGLMHSAASRAVAGRLLWEGCRGGSVAPSFLLPGWVLELGHGRSQPGQGLVARRNQDRKKCGQQFDRTRDRAQLCNILTSEFLRVRLAFWGDLGEAYCQETGPVSWERVHRMERGTVLTPRVGSGVLSTLCLFSRAPARRGKGAGVGV